jgi:hypothetical protein
MTSNKAGREGDNHSHVVGPIANRCDNCRLSQEPSPQRLPTALHCMHHCGGYASAARGEGLAVEGVAGNGCRVPAVQAVKLAVPAPVGVAAYAVAALAEGRNQLSLVLRRQPAVVSGLGLALGLDLRLDQATSCALCCVVRVAHAQTIR